MSNAQGTPAVCQIDNCGVLAVGRCTFCGRTFCTSHQARSTWGDGSIKQVYTDVCLPCYPKTKESQDQQAYQQTLNERHEARQYFESGAARLALIAAKVPSVEIYSITQEYQPTAKSILGKFFGSPYRPLNYGDRVIDVVTSTERGWIIGEFEWQYTPLDNDSKVQKICLTAVVDIATAPRDLSIYDDLSQSKGLVRVQAYASGYERLAGHYQELVYTSHAPAMQAVKRLIGESS